MPALPPSLEHLIEELTRLPTIGRRSAERLAFHLLKTGAEDAEALARAISEARRRLRFCEVCGNIAEEPRCEICRDSRRDAGLLCVVEDPRDALAFENSGGYNGLYHCLGGCISPLKGITPEKLTVAQLVRRAETGQFHEAILATSPSVDGDATALYLQKLLVGKIIKITRIGFGISIGSNLENVDRVTLQRSLEGRREL